MSDLVEAQGSWEAQEASALPSHHPHPHPPADSQPSALPSLGSSRWPGCWAWLPLAPLWSQLEQSRGLAASTGCEQMDVPRCPLFSGSLCHGGHHS